MEVSPRLLSSKLSLLFAALVVVVVPEFIAKLPTVAPSLSDFLTDEFSWGLYGGGLGGLPVVATGGMDIVDETLDATDEASEITRQVIAKLTIPKEQ